ncbi:hypothetical protein [Nitratireductor basaltis]|uniref:Uncharacterized protein n=1 Tax=Nitratireductor basaltis TaxID=472175 RepID=A0A084U6D7_9HYPH|nr:hypothetical protein [Nitratireductor basaltis]KFB08523.1 hypothetical protein EL18_02774 [Nitratireductor basaltis]
MNKRKMREFSRRHWFPVSGFFLSVFLAVWFSFTFLAEAIYFNDDRHQDVVLKPWMTPRYVALSYDLPREVVFRALELDPQGPPQRLRLGQIARMNGMTIDELTLRLREEAAEYRENASD